eukprot:190750_1
MAGANYLESLTDESKKNFIQYSSSHADYNDTRPWKLFQKSDYDGYSLYGLGITNCTLDGQQFATNKTNGRSGHFLCSRQHQVALFLLFLIFCFFFCFSVSKQR